MPRTRPPKPDLEAASRFADEASGKLYLGERLWLHEKFPTAAAEAEAYLEKALAIVRAWRKKHGR